MARRLSLFRPLRALLRPPVALPLRACRNSTSFRQPSHGTSTTTPPPWRSENALDEWVQREARPTSLRQLTVFGRMLTEARLLSSANYVRLELPTRLAHRLRDMQTLPYSALINSHISHVYELYYRAFELFRSVPEVRTLADNERFCDVLRLCLREHMSVIPRLAIGILEVQAFVPGEDCDRFIATLLRSRISRRVIAEQHLALTNTFHSPRHSSTAKKLSNSSLHEDDFVGEIFLKCNASEIIDRCARTARDLSLRVYGPDVPIPEIHLHGHLDTTFPYIPSHIEYIVGELLRNSIQAVVEERPDGDGPLPPIDVLICEAAQHIIIRVSDEGGGVPRELLPHLWSFAKGPRRSTRLENLVRVPRLAATMQELQHQKPTPDSTDQVVTESHISSLSSLSGRPPNLRLGIGLPMSRIYAEYWAGSLELQSLDGYGTDAFLQISRLGNKNEVLSTRTMMDGV